MAGFGADVVRIEGPPGGLTDDEAVYLLPGKRRITATEEELRALALAADIVVEDRKPGTLASMGMDPLALRGEKPSLIVVSITPFGQTGPAAQYEATNAVSFAMGGIMSLTGHPSRPPLVTGGSQAQYLGGLNGFSAAVTAYFGVMVHGEGDWIDISLQECAAGMLELYGARSEYDQVGPSMRAGNHVRAVWGIYPCADGYAGVCALERQVPALFRVVGDPALKEERFTDITQRAENDDELQAIMYGWFLERTKQEILELSPVHRVPFGAVLTPKDLLENASLAERGFFDEVETPEGMARVPGRPFLGFEWRPGRLEEPVGNARAVLDSWAGGAK
jgi:CoA:oxalate CoA-transferase